MNTMRMKLLPVALMASMACLAVPSRTLAAGNYSQLKSEVEELKKEVAELRGLLKQTQTQSISKDEAQTIKKQAAQATADTQVLKEQVAKTSAVTSEWNNTESVVHLGGYGAAGYTDRKNSNGSFQVFSFAPIFHYSYKDLMLMQAEIEMGYTADGETETTLEYATLGLFLNDYATLIAGQFLSPIGQFRQNMHPSWINKMPSMPAGFMEGGAIPLSETGLELRGGFPLGSWRSNYAAYIGNGPQLVHPVDGAGNDILGEMEIETAGRNMDNNGNKTFGGRIGLLPIHNLEFGLSGALGKARLPGEADRDYSVIDADFAYQPAPVELRGEYVRSKVGALSSSVDIPGTSLWKAWYIQASHKFLPSKWEGVLRYSKYDPAAAEERQKQWSTGVNYLFSNNVIGKFAYEFNTGEPGTPNDENRLLFQIAYGF